VGGKGGWWGQGEEITQALYAHKNNKSIKKDKKKRNLGMSPPQKKERKCGIYT
jgi:hypothetical protein